MNCGIYCVREYLSLKNISEKKIVIQLVARITERGISIHDIISVLRDNGLKMKAFKARKLPQELPVILYLPFFRHFILVIKADEKSYYVTDNLLGCRRIPRPFFRFLFSNICLMMI